ncbi:MAG: hypothetical protein K8U03_01935 [Planctomycetia bacterium]|nr:hypothetical protein [Planctomycetia bacterium]
MKFHLRFGLLSTALLLSAMSLTATSLMADEPKPAAKSRDGATKPSEAAPSGERKPNAEAPRGERQTDGRRGGARSLFPDEVKLTAEQLTKLEELQTKINTQATELSKKRDAILTDEQRTARDGAYKKMREGNLSRQEAADLIATAVKPTAEQKTKLDAVEEEARKLRGDAETQRLALLTPEQKTTYRKVQATRDLERMFAMPGDFTLTDEQKKGLKTLQDELIGELTAATEKRDVILTDERKAAREAAYKDIRENNKDRQAAAEALDAALKLTDAEKSELSASEQKLNELRQKIQERKLALLTAEQKQEFEKKFGSRSR